MRQYQTSAADYTRRTTQNMHYIHLYLVLPSWERLTGQKPRSLLYKMDGAHGLGSAMNAGSLLFANRVPQDGVLLNDGV